MADLNIRVNVDPGGAGAAATRRVSGEVSGLRVNAEAAHRATMTLSQGLATFGMASTGINAVVGGLERIARSVGEAERHSTALRNLGSAYSLVAAATADSVSAEDAYRTQQSLTQAGISVTGEMLAVIARRAREYSHATGVELPQSLEQLTEALRNGEAGGLRRYGVAVAEGTNRTTAFREATERWREEQGRVPVAANTAAESLNNLRRGLESVRNDLVNGIATIGRYVSSLLTIPDAANSIGTQERLIREGGRGDNTNTLRRAGLSDEQISRLSPADQMNVGFNLRRGVSLEVVLAGIPALRQQDAENRERLRRSREDDRLAQRALDDAFAPGAQERFDQARNRARGGGGGGISAGQRGERRRAAREWAFQQFGLTPEQQQQEAIDQANREADERGPGFDRERFARGEGTGESLDAARDRGRRNSEQAVNELERNNARLNNVGEQFRNRFRSIFGETQTLAQRSANIVGGAFESMTGAFRSHLGALIEGRETVGEALRGIVHETLLNLATESAVQALFQTAQGFAALATYRYAEAGQHFTAAGMYAGVAVAAGVGAALTNAPQAQAGAGAGGGGVADRSPRIGGAASGGGGGSGGLTIVQNFSSAIVTRADAEDAVTRAAAGGLGRGVRIERIEQVERARASR